MEFRHVSALTEQTMVRRPTPEDKLTVVCFTEWEQAQDIMELLGAGSFDLHVSYTNDDPPVLQFHVQFQFRFDPAMPRSPIDMSDGDYLGTHDDWDVDPMSMKRRWQVYRSDELHQAFETCRPGRP